MKKIFNDFSKTNRIGFIYWFAYYNLDSPSVRYRAKYPLDYAKNEIGLNSQLVIPGYTPKKLGIFIFSYCSALFFPKKNCLIIIQRVRSNFIYANLLMILVKFRKNLTVFDLDDADYLEYDSRTLKFFIRNCQYISAGSQEMVKHLKPLNRNIYHLSSPTPDLGIFKEIKNDILTIGWIGGYSWGHKESLFHFLFPAVKSLPFKCNLVMIGITKLEDENELRDYFKNSSHVNIEIQKNIDWKNEVDIQNKIRLFDVGIATLMNTPVQLAKSGIKAKQYLNNGVPVLCNNLPENNNVVVSGYNGFYCDTVQEFRNRLMQFNEMDFQEYKEFSINSRKSILNFNHISYFENLQQLK